MRVVHRPSKHRQTELEARARSMRHAPTRSEGLLFQAVRGRQLGYRVLRIPALLVERELDEAVRWVRRALAP